MDDKHLLPYTQKRSASRSPSPRRSRNDNGMPDMRSHSKSGKYRDRMDVHRSMKGYSRSRSHSPGPRMKKSSYKSSKYESRRSRSRSRSGYRARISRSRSRSYSRYSRERSPSMHQGHRRRNESRSPHSNRKRHIGNRDDPRPNRCLGVFGLSVGTTENQIYDIFEKYGPVERVTIVIDAKTKRPKGYCFVYFTSIEDARVAKEQSTGMEIEGRRIRVDYSITERAHTPTPGLYMGKVTHFDNRGGGSGDWGGPRRRDNYRNYRRSPSPYYNRRRSRYDRSRSRSYSPRRY